MKIDWTQSFLTPDGQTVTKTNQDGTAGDTITLGELVVTALNTPKKETNGEEDYERYETIKAIKSEDDLTVNQVALCLKACKEHPYVPFVKGQIVDFLNQKKTNLKLLTKEG